MINLFLILLTLALPWGNLLRFQIFPEIFIRLLDLLVAGLLFVILFKERGRYIKKLFRKYRAVVFMMAILVLSNLTPNRYHLSLGSAFYLIRTLGYLLLIPFFWERKRIKTTALIDFVRLSLVIIVVTGLIQYWLYPDLRNLFYLGYDPHAYRLFGFYFDPNVLGLILVWGFFFELRFPNKINRLFLPLTFLALLLTYSRISWLTFLIGLSYYLVSKDKTWFLGIFGAGFLLLVLLLPKHFGEGTNIFRVNSLLGKVASLKLTQKTLSEEQWVLGIGFNKLSQVKVSPNSTLPDNSQYGIDSSLLTVLLTSGLLGVAAYLWLFWSFGKENDWLLRVLSLTYFIHSLSVNSFFTPGVYFYYLLLVFLIKKTTQRSLG